MCVSVLYVSALYVSMLYVFVLYVPVLCMCLPCMCLIRSSLQVGEIGGQGRECGAGANHGGEHGRHDNIYDTI